MRVLGSPYGDSLGGNQVAAPTGIGSVHEGAYTAHYSPSL